MIIGIDASRAFLKNRTGIEEYSYRVIKGLTNYLQKEQVILYVRKNQKVDFGLPKNWNIKTIHCPRLWTQIGLAWEMLRRPADVLFVPAHTVPFIHPKKTIVTIHGLEYEFVPQGYSRWAQFYMRWTISKSCQWASKIIAVSENTKKDLMKLYKVPEKKIEVIYEGYDNNFQLPIFNLQSIFNDKNVNFQTDTKYLLFVGRIEERKNISNIVKAFEILKEKYQLLHKLILIGRPGHNYENIKLQISNSEYKEDIIEPGFITDEEKFELMKKADVFVFPTLYEGFGIPILEAQSVGCPVVAGNNSSIPEVAKESALLVDSRNPQEIAEAVHKLLSDKAFNNGIIEKGLENVKRFSWDGCAQKIFEILQK